MCALETARERDGPALACLRELNRGEDHVNPAGDSIALLHSDGAFEPRD